MEEIAEGFARALGGILRWVLWEFLFHILLFNLGRFFLLLVTLGRYPRGRFLESDINKISGVGLALIVVCWIIIALYNNYG